MEFFKVIKGRRSIRKFEKKDVPDEIIKKLIDAARYAPSSQNSQPWEFIIIRNKKTKDKFASTRSEENQVERQAPVLIIVCANLKRSETRWIEDCSLAAQNFALAAYEQGLSAVWVTGWCGFGKTTSESEEAIKKELNLPSHIRPLCVLALGYPAEEPEPKELKKIEEMVHYEKWQ